MTTKLLLLLLLLASYHGRCCSCRSCYWQAGRYLFNTKSVEEATIDELGVSRGVCNYHFISYVGYEETMMCRVDDEYILHLLPPPGSTDQIWKPPKMFDCIRDNPLIVNNTNVFRIMTSVPDIVHLLRPIGNNTKRYQSGSCVLVYFHTQPCSICRLLAVPVLQLPFAFKNIPVAAIDAYKFPRFKTEFGIASLPTLMLFHQGRPAVRYKGQGSVIAFVNRHTGLEPRKVPNNNKASLRFNNKVRIDYVFVVTWLSILACAGYYLNKL